MKRTPLAVLSLLALSGCASTSVEYGPFKYESAKDVALTNVDWTKGADGSEHFHADSVGGVASTVDQVQANAIKDLVGLAKDLAAKAP